jgi:nitroreductase
LVPQDGRGSSGDAITFTVRVMPTDLETIERLSRDRRATRHFRPTPVPAGLIDRLLDVARWAPSGYNLQPTHYVVVDDPESRAALSAACMGQAPVRDAPVVVVFTGDGRVVEHHFEDVLRMEREAQAITPEYEKLIRWAVGLGFGSGPAGLGWLWKATLLPLVRLFRPVPSLPAVHQDFWLAKQGMLSAMNFMLAAEAAGLSTLPMEGFDGARVRRVLGIPRAHTVLVVIAVGYAVPRSPRKTRLPIERVLHHNTW